MTPQWQPFSEPLRTTVVRTVAIAVIAGAVFARFSGGMARWPAATLVMLWPSLGGHWVEIWFLNWLRPRIPAARAVQIGARLCVWFAGGVGLAYGMRLTATVLAAVRPARWPAFWLGGAAFVAIELVAQVGLQLRGRPSFYNGRG